jgi:hypothetical protein
MKFTEANIFKSGDVGISMYVCKGTQNKKQCIGVHWIQPKAKSQSM